MLNMNNFMSFHDGSVQVAFENKSFQVAKKANPDLGEGSIPQCGPRQRIIPKRSVRPSADPTHVGLGIIWRPQILMAHQTSGYVSTADGQTAVFRASLTPKMDVWMEQWKNRAPDPS